MTAFAHRGSALYAELCSLLEGRGTVELDGLLWRFVHDDEAPYFESIDCVPFQYDTYYSEDDEELFDDESLFFDVELRLPPLDDYLKAHFIHDEEFDDIPFPPPDKNRG